MTPARNRRIRELFDAAVSLSAEAQGELLWRECGDDEDLVRAVWRLLEANRKSDGFLAAPLFRAPPVEESFGVPGSTIGPYKIVRELGCGGMGIVYQAVRADHVFRRVMALKVIRPDFVNERLIAGFQQERRILGDLDHPHIARIVDGGSTEQGLPYFVMDFVDGVPIDRFCKLHNLSMVHKLFLFRQVCAATSYLHESRVVHGDMKPSNILVAVDGNVKIVDFGIARVLDRTGVPNPDGAAIPVMTPGYASPEQLRGEAPGVPSDIYSLGVVLYELLTGVKPHLQENRSIQEILTVVNTQDPTRPSKVLRALGTAAQPDKSLRGDLGCIVRKALGPDPSARYSSVRAFDADIERYLSGCAVEARQGGPIYQASRFLGRNRLGTALFLIFVALLALTGWQALELRKNHRIKAADELNVQTSERRAISDLQDLSRSTTEPGAGKLLALPPSFGGTQMRDLHGLEEAYRASFPEAIHIWPGLNPQRKELLDEAHLYLREAEPMVADDLQARRELARAWLLVGDVEGDPQAPNLHDRAGAAESYRESSRLLERVLQENSGDRTAKELADRVDSHAKALKGSN